MADFDSRKIAQILYSETKNLVPDPTRPSKLDELRSAMAAIIAVTQGAGFNSPELPDPYELDSDVRRAAWKGCLDAANAMPSVPQVGPEADRRPANAVFFSSEADWKNDTSLQEQYPWIAKGVAPVLVGQAKSGNTPDAPLIYLFAFQAGAGIKPGRYPRPAGSEEAPAGAPTWQDGAKLLFWVALLVLVGSGCWSLYQSHGVRDTVTRADEALQGKLEKATENVNALAGSADASARSNAQNEKAVLEKTKKSRDDARIEYEQKRKAMEEAHSAIADKPDGEAEQGALTRSMRAMERARAAYVKQYGGAVSIVAAFIWALIGLLALMSCVSRALGLGTYGFLIDERGRMSLSRFQFVVWTLTILSAYWTAAAWNVGLATGSSQVVLPTMQIDLWILLGIVTASPLFSTLILDSKPKGNPGSPSPEAPPTANSGVTSQPKALSPLEVRLSGNASFLDLFIGEYEATASTVDISRLQQFIFTLVTVFTFLALSVSLFYCLAPGEPIDSLPHLDKYLVGLLGLSHAAYLTAKMIPKK